MSSDGWHRHPPRPVWGLIRIPLATVIIFTTTTLTAAAQWWHPDMLAQLERTPAALETEPWRIVTSLFVQDGGVIGSLSNLAFLLVLGAAAEQVVSRPRLLLAYVGVGVLSELIGYLWQPVGGGNSVAVCGLAGVLAVALWRRDPRLPGFTAVVALLWSVALLSMLSRSWLIACAIVGSIAVGWVIRLGSRGATPSRSVAMVVVLTAAVLVAFRDIHGGALAVGLLVAVALMRTPIPRGSRPMPG